MKFLLVLFSFLTLATCGGGDNEAVMANPSVAGSPAYDDMDIEAVEEVSIASKEAVAQPQKQIQKKVIKTGNLRFETQDLDKTRSRILTAVQKAGGYIQSDNSGKNYNTVYQNIAVRVPSANFDSLLKDITAGIAFFDEKSISQRDVTEEFVDIQARLKAKRALEERYLNLLAKAKTVREMLEIERELSNIREEIESKQGRLKYLQSQVSESTLYINFYKETAETGATVSYGTKIVNALKSGWNGISIFFLGLLHVWPFLILVGIGTFFLRRFLKKQK